MLGQRSLIFCFFALFLSGALIGQTVERDSLGFARFSYEEGDTTFQMKQYFLVLLKRPNTPEEYSPEELDSIQRGHLGHLNQMGKAGLLDLAGPTSERGMLRGILLLRVATRQEAEALVSQDPAVQAGRLEGEIHGLWLAEGSQLK